MKRAILTCLVLLAGEAWAGINHWTFDGPDSGAAWTIAVHPSNSNIVIAGTIRGFYRSTNAGASWILVSEGVTNGSGTVSIAFDPLNPNRVFAATSGNLYRSDDAGETWTLQENLNNGQFYIVEFTAAGTLYAHSQSSQVRKSTDRGATWTQCAQPWGPDVGSNSFKVDPNPNLQDHLFIEILTNDPGRSGTWRSVDGCNNWVPAGSGNPGTGAYGRVRRYSVEPGNPNRVIAASNLGLMVSNDGGNTWVNRWPGEIWWADFDPTTPGDAYGMVDVSHVIRSTNSGDSWNYRTTTYAVGESRFTLDPSIPGRMWAGTGNGPFLSNDSAGQFVLRNSGMRAGIIGNFSAADDGTVYAVFNQGAAGVFRRNPATQAWSPVNNAGLLSASLSSHHQMTHVRTAPTNSARIYAGAGSVSLVRSLDSGATWDPAHPAFYNSQAIVIDTSVDPDNELVAYVATSNSGLFKTIDGGTNWTPVNGVPFFLWTVLAAPGSDTVYAAAGTTFPTDVYKSTNGGATWTLTGLTPPPGTNDSITQLAIDASNPDTVYAIYFSGIYKSTNAGNTWARMNLPEGVFGRSVLTDPVFPDTIMVSSTRYGSALARTIDGGTHWEAISIPSYISYNLIQRAVLDPLRPNIVIAAVGGAGVGEYEIATDLSVSVSGIEPVIPTTTTVTAQLNVRNNGPHGASPSELTVNFPTWLTPVLPAGCNRSSQTLTCPVPALPVGASYPLSVSFAVSAVGGAGQFMARITPHETEFSAIDNVVTIAVSGEARAALAVSLTPLVSTIVHDGTTTLTATVTNRGPSTATGTVFSLRAPPGLPLSAVTTTRGTCTSNATDIDCAIGTMEHNGTTRITMTVTGAALGHQLVSAYALAAGLVTGNEHASTTILVAPVGDASVTLAESADPITVGTNYQYTATVRNDGPDAGDVNLTMPTSGGTITSLTSTGNSCSFINREVTCHFAALAPGAPATIVVNFSADTAGIAVATASLQFIGMDTNYDNNTATIGTTLRNVGDISVEISDSVQPAQALSGTPYLYLVTVRNAGPNVAFANVDVAVTGATVTGTASATAVCTNTAAIASCNIAGMMSGGVHTFTVTVNPAPGNASATATATLLNGIDPNTANNAATDSTGVQRVGDVGVEITESADPVVAGSPFNYVAAVRNQGPDSGTLHLTVTLNGASVASATPTGGGLCIVIAAAVDCDFVAMPSGASANVTIQASATGSSFATADARVNFGGVDPVPANNSAIASTTISARPSSGGGNGGGGGGSFDWLAAALLGLLLARRRFAAAVGRRPGYWRRRHVVRSGKLELIASDRSAVR